MDDYWHKQTTEPLYPDLLWSRPENKRQAGKLLIIGGNVHGFAAVGEAYSAAVTAGIGTAHVLLPDALQKSVGQILENADFASSTPSGSFSRKSLSDFIDHSAWADGVLLAGDLGRNSETAILLETYIQKYPGLVVLTKDAVDYFTTTPQLLLGRADSLIVLTLAQLQKFVSKAHLVTPISFSMDLLQLVHTLHELTTDYKPAIIVKHLDTILVAHAGQISTTKTTSDLEDRWRVGTASAAAVWALQNPAKLFAALTTAVHETNQ